MQKGEKKTDQLWALIAVAMEHGFITHFQLKGTKADQMKGRNAIRIPIQSNDEEQHITMEGEDQDIRRWQRRAGMHMAQANRLINITRRALAKVSKGDADAKRTNQQHNAQTWVAYKKEAKGMKYDTSTDKHHDGNNNDQAKKKMEVRRYSKNCRRWT